MAIVTIHSDFGVPPKRKSVTAPVFSPFICHEGSHHGLSFWMLSFKPAFSLSSFTLIKKFFSFSSLSAIRVVSSTYPRLLTFLPAILIPAYESSKLTFSNDVPYTVALISHVSKVMLKIIQARLQQHMNHELPEVQAGFRKGRRTRNQLANTHWIIEKAREFQKNIYFCFIDYAKAFDCVDHNKLWKTLKEMRIPDHLICLLRNLYAGQEATVRTGHGTTDWF